MAPIGRVCGRPRSCLPPEPGAPSDCDSPNHHHHHHYYYYYHHYYYHYHHNHRDRRGSHCFLRGLAGNRGPGLQGGPGPLQSAGCTSRARMILWQRILWRQITQPSC